MSLLSRCFIFILSMMAMATPCPGCCNELIPAPIPFEKIYVSPHEVLTTPYGSYYRNPCGEYEKVRSVLRDCNGTYVIIVTVQCPICGKWYDGTKPEAGYCCPLDEIQIYPDLWTNP